MVKHFDIEHLSESIIDWLKPKPVVAVGQVYESKQHSNLRVEVMGIIQRGSSSVVVWSDFLGEHEFVMSDFFTKFKRVPC